MGLFQCDSACVIGSVYMSEFGDALTMFTLWNSFHMAANASQAQTCLTVSLCYNDEFTWRNSAQCSLPEPRFGEWGKSATGILLLVSNVGATASPDPYAHVFPSRSWA